MNKEDLTDVFENCPCFRARAAARRITRDYDEAFKSIGIKSTQFTLLAIIKGKEPSSITTMADKLAMERTSLIRTLELMAEKGLITLAEEGYRRERKVQITPKGDAILAKALPLWKQMQASFVSRIGQENWQANKELWLDIAFGD
ncbi:MarR family winged helix-turn-helix transcriptional regulator [Pseudohongiella sp.]|uniref:HTH marR-type domain-containing protein n=1 Tax=marine sediment metagenome TaxID=412755 RepID=A0A0F9W7R9_9ZZZZ|nr:winged helix DNA-binding protein [Pseudohongiella sp.]HDZ07550.1 MarR family transcriptional regulator [Pseudohongiella sp.]HEA62945.1 MarR family transcriptional regulator [Pseudohongiella sp.]